MKSIRIVGLTGQTGAGKSTVSETFRGCGIEVIDCDHVCHEVLKNDKQLLADLALEFGIGILNEDGALERKRLGAIVFNHKEKLLRLNKIIFPYIIAEVMRRVEQLRRAGVRLVVLDAPTLFESGLDKECADIVSVIAPETERLNRIMVRDHLTDAEARSRIASQHSDDFYTARSTLVLRNSDDIAALRAAAAAAARRLLRANG